MAKFEDDYKARIYDANILEGKTLKLSQFGMEHNVQWISIWRGLRGTPRLMFPVSIAYVIRFYGITMIPIANSTPSWVTTRCSSCSELISRKEKKKKHSYLQNNYWKCCILTKTTLKKFKLHLYKIHQVLWELLFANWKCEEFSF